MGADEAKSNCPRVSMQTAYGPIVCEVRVDRAPITAGNFLRYIDEGWYEGARFYRVIRPDNGKNHPRLRIIQGGIDPTCRQAPASPISHESTTKTGLAHTAGALSMARWEPGTAASEFFIVLEDAPELDCSGEYDEGYAVFGRVTAGMNVVSRISASATGEAAASLEYMKDQAILVPVPIALTRLTAG